MLVAGFCYDLGMYLIIVPKIDIPFISNYTFA